MVAQPNINWGILDSSGIAKARTYDVGSTLDQISNREGKDAETESKQQETAYNELANPLRLEKMGQENNLAKDMNPLKIQSEQQDVQEKTLKNAMTESSFIGGVVNHITSEQDPAKQKALYQSWYDSFESKGIPLSKQGFSRDYTEEDQRKMYIAGLQAADDLGTKNSQNQPASVKEWQAAKRSDPARYGNVTYPEWLDQQADRSADKITTRIDAQKEKERTVAWLKAADERGIEAQNTLNNIQLMKEFRSDVERGALAPAMLIAQRIGGVFSEEAAKAAGNKEALKALGIQQTLVMAQKLKPTSDTDIKYSEQAAATLGKTEAGARILEEMAGTVATRERQKRDFVDAYDKKHGTITGAEMQFDKLTQDIPLLVKDKTGALVLNPNAKTLSDKFGDYLEKPIMYKGDEKFTAAGGKDYTYSQILKIAEKQQRSADSVLKDPTYGFKPSTPAGQVEAVKSVVPTSSNNQVQSATKVAEQGGTHMDIATRMIGSSETKDKTVLAGFFKNTLGQDIDPTTVPWCAAFVNGVLKTTGQAGTGSLAARSFLNYGESTTNPKQGDIVVLSRGGDSSKGHVGFFAGYDENGNVKVLGGNQDNSVKIKSYSADKVLAFRTSDKTDAPKEFLNSQYTQVAALGAPLPGSLKPEVNQLELIKKFEGFYAKPYWDVNAHRIGYGSDTITRSDGSIVKVKPGMRVSKEDAERDLVRRTAIFEKEAAETVGKDKWEALHDGAQAALTSVAYNYGSLPKTVVSAVKTGDLTEISKAVRNLGGHNRGINKSRRNKEADLIIGKEAPARMVASNRYALNDSDEVMGNENRFLPPVTEIPSTPKDQPRLIPNPETISDKAQQAREQDGSVLTRLNPSKLKRRASVLSRIG